MTPNGKIMSTAVGLALALTACSGEAGAQAEDTDMEEAADTAPDETPETAVDHDATAYAEDDTGGQIGAEIVDPLNERLAAFHAESGRDVHVILAMTTEGRDIETVAEEARAEREADALIYVAGADQALAIVGDGLDDGFTGDTELAMIAHFEENRLVDGLNAGVDAVTARLAE